MAVKSWSTTAADNDDADTANGIIFTEGQAPSTVNNSMRALMAEIKKDYDRSAGWTYAAGTVGGTADAITLTHSPAPAAYAAGQRFAFKATATNTGAVTVNVDTLGAKAVQYRGAALAAGDITNGNVVVIVYDGTQFQMVSPKADAAVSTTYDYAGATVGGTANAITLDYTPNASYTTGARYAFLATATNTAAATVNVDGLGAKDIKKRNAALSPGDIMNGQLVVLTYDGTDMELLGQENPASLFAPTVGGTADAITLTYSPAVLVYVTGQEYRFTAASASTSTTPTVNINGLGAKTIQKNAAALAAGDIASGASICLIYDGTNMQLVSPAAAVSTPLTASGSSVGNISNGVSSNVERSPTINAQTGTTYTFLAGDRGKLVTFSNTSSIAVTLPQAGGTGFGTSWFVDVLNLNTGVVTITPTTSTIDGGATYTLAPGAWARIHSDNTNYRTISGGLKPGKHTIHVPASGMTSRTTNGAGSSTSETTANDNMLVSKDFDTTTPEFVNFRIPFPKSSDESKGFTAQFGWYGGTAAGHVVWGIAGVARSDHDALDAAFGTAVTITDSLTSTSVLHISTETATLTPAGTWAEGDEVEFTVFRDASADTNGGDAKLLWVRLFHWLRGGDDA